MLPIFDSTRWPMIAAGLLTLLTLAIAGCGREHAQEAEGSAAAPGSTVVEETIVAVSADPRELPTWRIPNVPDNAEAYYAPDNLHVIAQTQDPDALKSERRGTGALTYTFTDQGEDIMRINDRGQARAPQSPSRDSCELPRIRGSRSPVPTTCAALH